MTSPASKVGWHTAPLKHLLSRLVSGGTPDSDNDVYWAPDGASIPWVTIADMTRQDVVTETHRRLTDAGFASKRLSLLAPGTLLYSIYASLGRTAVLGVPGTTNQAILALIPRSDVLDGCFLRWWLEHKRSSVVEAAATSTQDNLSAEVVRNIEVLVPPLPEQSAIAAFLDRETTRLDVLIAKKTQLLALLEETRTALITRAVTKGLDPTVPTKDSGVEWLGEVPAHWEVLPLRRISRIRYGLGQPPAERANGLPFIRATNLHAGRILDPEMVYVDPSDVPATRDAYLKAGEVIVVRSGAYTGDSAIVPPAYAGAVIGYDLVLTVVKAVPEFAAWQLLSPAVRDLQFGFWQLRAAQPHLNAEELGSTLVTLPPPHEQRLIAAFLERRTAELDALTGRIRAAITLLREYRNALISAAVTGQIDVRERIAIRSEAMRPSPPDPD